MTWRIEAAAAEAERIAALLRDSGNSDGATIVDARASGLRDALAWIAEEAEEEPEEEAPAEPTPAEDPPPAAAPEPISALAALHTEPPAPSASVAPNPAPPAPPRLRASADGDERDLLTAERRAALPALWSNLSFSVAMIAEALNRMPGREVKAGSVYWLAHRCGLPTKRVAPADPFAGIPEDDLREARDMMRAGSVGALALQEYFGWELPRAQEIAAALRAEIQAEGKAA